MSWKLSFDPKKYKEPLNMHGKQVMQHLLDTWVNTEEENIELSFSRHDFQNQLSFVNTEPLTIPAKNIRTFGTVNNDNFIAQDYNNNNIEYEKKLDSEILPRISSSPMWRTPSYSLVKAVTDGNQNNDLDEIIPATIFNGVNHDLHCNYNNSNTIKPTNQPTILKKLTSDNRENHNAIKENVSIQIIPEIHNCVTVNKDIFNTDKNVVLPGENEDISWDNMIDAEQIFGLSFFDNPLDQNDGYANEEINAQFSNQLNKNKPKASDKIYSTTIPMEMLENRDNQSLCTLDIETIFNKGTKRKYKQKKNTILLTKKVKNTEEIIDKKKYTTVNDWLMNNVAKLNEEKDGNKKINEIHDKVLLQELGSDKISLFNNKRIFNSKNMLKQTRLVNKGGIMKYSEEDKNNRPVKFSENGQNLKFSHLPAMQFSDKDETQEFVDISTMLLSESDKSQNIRDNLTKQFSDKDITHNFANPPKIVDKNRNIVDKIKKKSKFMTPFKSQLPVSNIRYEIDELINLEAISTFESIILSEETTLIAMTIIYREGFCQLNKNYDGESCLPEGLIICCNKSNFSQSFYYIPLLHKDDNEFRQFVANLMISSIRKICFEAQDLIMLLADLLKFEFREIISKWILDDPKIGGFLLDPDKPPECFSELQSQIQLFPDFTITSPCVKQKSAWCLTLLVDCAEKIDAELNHNSLIKIFQIETRLIAIVSAMELRGLSVNVDTLKEIGRTIEDKMNSVEMQAYQCTDKLFQINSPVQLRTILYDELKLDLKCNIKVRETICLGAKSTSEPILKLLAASHPLPRLVLEYRHLHKALATFVNGMLQHAKNGIIKATWEQTAAATGRISSSNPNLQAIPKNPFALTLFPASGSQDIEAPIYLRSAYSAREGYMLVAADFQHIESRIFAHLSGDEDLLEVFRKNKDFFRTLAGKWMNKVEDEVTSEERERTKRMVYAIMYGAGTRKLMEIMEINYEQTLTIIGSFARVLPSLKSFGQRVVQKCMKQDGVLESICGRRRRFPNIFSQNATLKAQAERQAVNFVIQGSAADLCKIAMIVTEEHLTRQDVNIQYGLILQIHDELVWEVDQENVTLAKGVIKSAMESCSEICGLSIPLPVSVTSGKNWAVMT